MTLNNNNPPCDTGFFERLNYYYGKLMTVRDFETEQSYFNEKRWLLNRRTIGWGIVCGLEVIKNEKEKEQLIVKPGLAVDQYGNEIVVCQHHAIDQPGKDNNFFVCIKYKWCYSEPVPRPAEECGDFRTECEYNRIRETFELKAVEENDNDELYMAIGNQWDKPFEPKIDPGLDCIPFLENPCPPILQSCEPRNQEAWLVLAKVILNASGEVEEIDNCTLRKLLFSNERLYETTRCLKHELWKIHTARIDRRQFVPLLAQTIKGLEYRDGRILTFKENVGKEPFNITTDGDNIWITDKADENIIIIDRYTNQITPIKIEIEMETGKVTMQKSWGIAFDGEFMWITHHEDKVISKINAKTFKVEKAIVLDEEDELPREIVFNGKYLIVSQPPELLSLIDAKTGKIVVPNFVLPSGYSPVCMTYDGTCIWAASNDTSEKGLRTITIEETNSNINIIVRAEGINIGGREPKSIFFDGTHIWISHNDGLSKIDIDEEQSMTMTVPEKPLYGLGFDGMFLWICSEFHHVIRYDITKEIDVGRFELKVLNHKFAKICFDGLFLWITAFDDTGTENKGVIQRFLI